MRQYVIKRLLLAIPTVLGVSLVIFLMVRLVPGDVVTLMMAESGYASQADLQKVRAQLGLDKPVYTQYFLWLGRAVKGDLGYSFYTRDSVGMQLIKRVPVTIELALLTLIFSATIAIVVGVTAAIRQDTVLDYLVRSSSILGLSMPTFWTGLLVLLGLSLLLHWSPPILYRNIWEQPSSNLQKLIFPALALAWFQSASTMRLTRSSVLEVMRQDYVRTAWAKGLSERLVIFRHVLKNALIPVVTLMGVEFGTLLGGTVIIEVVFALPGVGRLTVGSILARDYPQIQANVLFIAIIFILVNLAVDLTYGYLDPRIRYQ
ncbi:MAG: ABC transporter permease [Chloroflexi bacterium]|nr:ABC transporter permease [Chloroflexota bacterium]